MSGSSASVSVVLPFRNASATLKEALDSISAQTLDSFECVLLDHSSSDASATIAAAHARRDRRFRLLHHGGSFVQALSAGVGAASSPLIARMDADDVCHPERLARQVDLLHRNPDLHVASCLVECFPRELLGQGMRRYESWLNTLVEDRDIRAALFIESPIPHPSAVFRRDLYDAVGGYRDDGGPEDYDLWLRMLLRGGRARKVPATLLRWRETPERMSRTDPRYSKRCFWQTKTRYFSELVKVQTPLQIWGSGPTARRWSRHLQAEGYEIRRFVDAVDGKIGRTVHGHRIEPSSALDRNDGLVVAAVGLLGAREIIETDLRRRGFLPQRDYLAVA